MAARRITSLPPDIERAVTREVERQTEALLERGRAEGRAEAAAVVKALTGLNGSTEAVIAAMLAGGGVHKAWNEASHPRSDDGRFVSAKDVRDASRDPKRADELRASVTDPGERKKLDHLIANAKVLGGHERAERHFAPDDTGREHPQFHDAEGAEHAKTFRGVLVGLIKRAAKEAEGGDAEGVYRSASERIEDVTRKAERTAAVHWREARDKALAQLRADFPGIAGGAEWNAVAEAFGDAERATREAYRLLGENADYLANCILRRGEPGAIADSTHPGRQAFDEARHIVGDTYRRHTEAIWAAIKAARDAYGGAHKLGRYFKAWEAHRHPRDDSGRFIELHAIEAAKTDHKKADALRASVTGPKERRKLDKALAAPPEEKPKGAPEPETPETAGNLNSVKRNSDAPRAKAGALSLDDTHDLARAALTKTGEAKKRALLQLADRLQGHTVSELQELKRRLGVRASGPKAELAKKIAERALVSDRGNLRTHAPHERLTAEAAHALIRGHLDAGRLADPAVRKELANLLEHRLSTADLHELKRKLGVAASGEKWQLAQRIAERAQAKHAQASAGGVLTADERAALASYKNAGYGPLNRNLRAGGELPPRDAGTVAALDSALAKTATTAPVTLHRGFGNRALLEDNGFPADPKPGDTFTDPGYASAFPTRAAAEKWSPGPRDVTATLSVPAGVGAARMDAHAGHPSDENETLLERGLTYRVSRVEPKPGGGYHLHLDVVKPRASASADPLDGATIHTTERLPLPGPAKNPPPLPSREPTTEELEGGPKPSGQQASRRKGDPFSPAQGGRFAGEPTTDQPSKAAPTEADDPEAAARIDAARERYKKRQAEFEAQRAAAAQPARPNTPEAHQQTAVDAVHDAIADGLDVGGMVPMKQIRAKFRAAHPGATDADFDAALLELRRADQLRLVGGDDASRDPENWGAGVKAVGENFIYAERGGATPARSDVARPATESTPEQRATAAALAGELRDPGHGMAPVHAMRAEWERRHPGGTRAQFNDALLAAARSGAVRLVPADDRSKFTKEQLRDAVTAQGHTNVYAEPTADKPAPAPAKPAEPTAPAATEVARPGAAADTAAPPEGVKPVADAKPTTAKATDLVPPDPVTDPAKLDRLAGAMRAAGGWNGRPVLAHERRGKLHAWTGSHRLSAAELAGVGGSVPVHVLDKGAVERAAKELGLPADFHPGDLDDAQKEKLAERIGDPAALELMRAERAKPATAEPPSEPKRKPAPKAKAPPSSGPGAVWHAFQQATGDGKAYLGDALHNAGAPNPESLKKLPANLDADRLADRLAGAYQDAHRNGNEAGKAAVGAALTHVGAKPHSAAGDIQPSVDAGLYDLAPGMFDGHRARVVVPAVLNNEGRVLRKGQAEPAPSTSSLADEITARRKARQTAESVGEHSLPSEAEFAAASAKPISAAKNPPESVPTIVDKPAAVGHNAPTPPTSGGSPAGEGGKMDASKLSRRERDRLENLVAGDIPSAFTDGIDHTDFAAGLLDRIEGGTADAADLRRVHGWMVRHADSFANPKPNVHHRAADELAALIAKMGASPTPPAGDPPPRGGGQEGGRESVLRSAGVEAGRHRVESHELHDGSTRVSVYSTISKKLLGDVTFGADGSVKASDRFRDSFPEISKHETTPPPAPPGDAFDGTLDLTKFARHVGHSYLARLTGPHPTYGFDRAFLDKSQVPGAGERQHRYTGLSEGVYESQGYGPKGARLYHQVTRGADGALRHQEITADEAKRLVGAASPADVRPEGARYTAGQMAQAARDYRRGKVVADDDLIVEAVKYGYLTQNEAMNRDY